MTEKLPGERKLDRSIAELQKLLDKTKELVQECHDLLLVL